MGKCANWVRFTNRNYPQHPVSPEVSSSGTGTCEYPTNQLCDGRWLPYLVRCEPLQTQPPVSPVQLSNSVHEAPSSRARAKCPQLSERHLRPLTRSRADRRQKLQGVRAPDSLPHHSAVSRGGGRTELQGPRHFLPVDHVDDTVSLVVYHFMRNKNAW